MAKQAAGRPAPESLPEQLRRSIEGSGQTAYALGRLTGVDRVQIQRFLADERGLTLETAGRICAALGLRLVEVGRRKAATGRDRS